MWGHIPQIIREAAKSPLGIWALIIVCLGLVGYGFFHQSPWLLKAGMFVLMFIGFGLFGVAAYHIPSDPKKKVWRISKSSPNGEILLSRADEHQSSGRNDQARTAYTEARMLYKQEEDRLGEANVLFGLGELERTLGRNDQARKCFNQAAHLYDALGFEDLGEQALQNAKGLGGLGE